MSRSRTEMEFPIASFIKGPPNSVRPVSLRPAHEPWKALKIPSPRSFQALNGVLSNTTAGSIAPW